MRIKTSILLLLLLTFITKTEAQIKWHDPLKAETPVIQNQAWVDEIGFSYTRMPQRAEQLVRTPVWNLSRYSAGLAIHFYSNSPEITVRYGVKGSLNMPHMPTLGVSGLDMYRVDEKNEKAFCYGKYAFKDTITYTYTGLEPSSNPKGNEYHLFLPLYNQVKWLEIGIPESAEFEFIPHSTEKPIVLYGTSIAQGACASRPAMAWGNIIQRSLDVPVINLGFSGNGRLEKEMLDFINEIDARLYILDCLPNLDTEEENKLFEIIVNAVRQLRSKSNTPILLIEHLGASYSTVNKEKREQDERVNRASKNAYAALLKEGIDNLYYLTREDLNIPSDGWVDYIHPTDLGMQAQADAVEKKIKEILKSFKKQPI